MKYLRYFENVDVDPFQEEDWEEKELYGMELYLSEDQDPVYNNGEPFKVPWTGKNWVLIKKNDFYYIIGEIRFTDSDFFMFYSDFRSIQNNRLKKYDGKIKRLLNEAEKQQVVDELATNFKMLRGFGNVEHYVDIINRFLNENLDVDPFDEENWEEEEKENKKFRSAYTIGETCPCGQEAYHKIGEIIFDDDPNPHRHELTQYLCDECFQKIMRPEGLWNL